MPGHVVTLSLLDQRVAAHLPGPRHAPVLGDAGHPAQEVDLHVQLHAVVQLALDLGELVPGQRLQGAGLVLLVQQVDVICNQDSYGYGLGTGERSRK